MNPAHAQGGEDERRRARVAPRTRLVLRSQREPPLAVPAAPELGLAWLVRLRWVAAGCQLAVLAAAMRFFAQPEASGAIAALIGVTFATNLGLSRWLRRGGRSTPWLIAAVLLLDTLVLTAMLHLSGGPTNPFTVFYLVHVALAALLLDTRGALLLSLFTSACFAGLFLFAGPVDPHAHHGADFSSHLQGMWISYTLAACFVGYFVAKVARALQRRERELASLQQLAARAERLASLSTLAAGAAHELGTPLGTIAIVARELERLSEQGDREEAGESSSNALSRGAIRDDARTLRAEAERCRRILDRMAIDAGQSLGERPQRVGAAEILRALEEELGPEATSLVSLEADEGGAVVAPLRSLTQALANLVRNGIDASEGRRGAPLVRVVARADAGAVTFQVSDRGKGMAADELQRIGEPFFTTKAPGKGLGLGLFLVRALAERCDGSLEVDSSPEGGSTFHLSLPAAP